MSLQKGGCLSHIRSGIHNSLKYGLNDMRHKNANMHVARNSKHSVSTTRACTGHHLVIKIKFSSRNDRFTIMLITHSFTILNTSGLQTTLVC